MSLFDNENSIMFIGGDSAEIWKGATKIREHLNSMFPDEKVTLSMDRTDIDINQNTAWVFADGRIKITLPQGDPIIALYRFTAILIKKNNTWKFRLYMGSNPKG
jgi:ketosteroid isomerase-like protein